MAHADQEHDYNVLLDAHREIIEIYAGMEGFIPETAAEGYLQRIVRQMADVSIKATGEIDGTRRKDTR